MKNYPRRNLSQSKQLKRSKATSIFLQVKRKGENDFGNSIGDKNTRSSEMKSKFQREQRTRIVFQKQKKKGKSTKFSGKLISFPTANSWEFWRKLKTGMRILWNL